MIKTLKLIYMIKLWWYYRYARNVGLATPFILVDLPGTVWIAPNFIHVLQLFCRFLRLLAHMRTYLVSLDLELPGCRRKNVELWCWSCCDEIVVDKLGLMLCLKKLQQIVVIVLAGGSSVVKLIIISEWIIIYCLFHFHKGVLFFGSFRRSLYCWIHFYKEVSTRNWTKGSSHSCFPVGSHYSQGSRLCAFLG